MEGTDKTPGAMRKNQGGVFLITDNHSPANSGVTEVVTQLSRYLASQGRPTTVLTADRALTPVPDGVDLVEFPLQPGVQTWRYPNNMGAYMRGIRANTGNIFHLHGVWGAPQWLAARTASQRGIPALITPHDMLSPWHWQDGSLRRLKKLIYWYTLAYPAFRHLSVIHAITAQERDHLTQYFPGQDLVVIPNAIDVEEVDKLLAAQDLELNSAVEPPYLLFLGRLHAKKGVELLLTAFARARLDRSFRLLIAGPAHTPVYAAKLRAQVKDLGLEDWVTFLGPVFGPQKWHLYRNAWAFCAPSYSEVVGLVNLEAAAAEVPVITTYETGLSDWGEGGGLLTHPRVEELSRALEQASSWDEKERNERGRQLRVLVERRYSWRAVGPQWTRLYSRLLENSG
jgi:glycosyltransferase involved in cell wall biosynthesis